MRARRDGGRMASVVGFAGLAALSLAAGRADAQAFPTMPPPPPTWTPRPPQVGACSLNGSCRVTSPTECTAQIMSAKIGGTFVSGTYLGDGSTCALSCVFQTYGAGTAVAFVPAATWASLDPARDPKPSGWSVTDTVPSPAIVASGTSLAPLGFPIVVDGKVATPASAFTTGPIAAFASPRTYVVQVQGKNGYGQTCSQSSPVSAPGLVPPPDGLSVTNYGAIKVAWIAPDPKNYGAVTTSVFWSTSSAGPWSSVANGVTATSYTLPAALAATLGGNVVFVAASVNAAGQGPLSRGVSLSLPPATPPAPYGSSTARGTVDLSWNASVGATSYTVKYSATTGGPYTTFGNVSGPSATITGLTVGKTYYFVVVANGPTGSSPQSAQGAVVVKNYIM